MDEAACGDVSGRDNIYVACGLTPAGDGAGSSRCRRGRLAVSDEWLDEYLPVLAADVRDPAKTSLLLSAISGTLDPAQFIHRPGEKLTVRLDAR